MRLFLYCEGRQIVFSVPDDTDFSFMIDDFYEEQVNRARAKGQDASKIHPLTPQQILDRLYKSERDSDRKFIAHNIQPSVLLSPDSSEGEEFPEHLLEDNPLNSSLEQEESLKVLHNRLIAGGLSEEQFVLLMTDAERTAEETQEDLASFMGLDIDVFRMRLMRARRKSEEILKSGLFSSTPENKTYEGQKSP